MIAEHARRHRDRLESDYVRTGYSRAQAEQIIARMDRTLAQVPAVITQAHERLIGDRTVPSEQKLVSIYEPDVKVIQGQRSSVAHICVEQTPVPDVTYLPNDQTLLLRSRFIKRAGKRRTPPTWLIQIEPSPSLKTP